MRRLFHHPAGDEDRIGKALQRGHGAGPLLAAVHDRGVELVRAGKIGRGALAGDVEARVLKRRDDLGDDIERALAGLQPLARLGRGFSHVGHFGGIVAARLGAGAAMKSQGNHRKTLESFNGNILSDREPAVTSPESKRPPNAGREALKD